MKAFRSREVANLVANKKDLQATILVSL